MKNFAYNSRQNTADAKGDYGYENKDGTVHKEVLGKDTNYGILVPVEEPVALTGEEYGMEDGEGGVKVQCCKAAYQGKATESVSTRREGDVHTEWTPQLVYPEPVEEDHQHRAEKRDYEGDAVKVKQHLAVLKVRFTVLAVGKISRAELLARYGKIVEQLVVCLLYCVIVGTRVFLDVKRLYLHVVEWPEVDGKCDGE